MKLASQLFEHFERLRGDPSSIKVSLSSQVYPAPVRDHGWLEFVEDGSTYYVIRLNAG